MQRITAFFKEYPDLAATILLALFAFALRYWFFWNYPYPLMLHEQDGIAYMSIAKELLAFKVPANLFMPPFYPFVIAIFSALPVKFELAARVASITMDALTVFPLYGLARIALPRQMALLVCLLWSTFTFSLFFTPSPLSQSTYLVMLFTGIYLLYRALSAVDRILFFALAGVCLSCAYLTRPEGVVSIGIALALTVVGALRPGVDRRSYLKGGIVLLCAFLLTASPYLLILKSTFGHWTFTAKTTVAIKGVDGSLTLGAGQSAVKGGLDLWLETFGGLSGGLKFIGSNVVGFGKLLAHSFSPWMHFFALIGIPFILIGRNFFNRLFFLFPLLMTVPVYIANLPKVHSYIYPLFPLYMIVFVAGAWGLISLAKNGIAKLWPGLPQKMVAVIAFLVLAVPVGVVGIDGCRDATANFKSPDYLFQVEQTAKVFKAAGDDIKALSAPRDLLMTRWGLVSYFAERPLMIMPKGEIEAVLAEGRKAGARFMLIDTESVNSRRQELRELLAPLYGRVVDPRYGIAVVGVRSTELGGYVIYRFM